MKDRYEMRTQQEGWWSLSVGSLRQLVESFTRARTNVSSVAQSFIVKIAVLALNAATSIITARVLSAGGRGEMSAIILWPGFFASLFTLGLPSSMIMQLRKSPDRSAETVSAAVWLASSVGCLSAFLGFFVVPIWLDKYSTTDITYARWVLLASIIPIPLYLGRCSLEAAGDFVSSNLSLWAQPAVTLIWLIVLIKTGNATPLSCGLAYLLGVLPSCLFLIFRVSQVYKLTFGWSLGRTKLLLHYGLRAWGADLLNALALSENVLVVHFLSPSEMGTYVVVASLARMLSVFQTSVNSVLLPRIAAKAADDVIRVTGLAFRITTCLAGVAAVIAGVMGPCVLRFVYGTHYAENGTTAFRILLAEVVLSGATSILAQAYLALDRPGTVTVIQAIGFGVALLMMPTLITRFGSAGAPIALLLSAAIRILTTLVGFPHLLHLSPIRLLFNRRDFEFVGHRLRWLQRT